MSKIEKELLAATELKAKRGEERQDLLGRIMKEVAELDDAAWDDLSQEAQDWFNDAADAKNAKAKTIPDFPDAEGDDEPEQEEEKPSTRRSAGKAKKAELEVGVVAKITNKRGKSFTGTVVELDDEIVVLKMGNGDEEEIDRSRIESFEIAGGEDAPAEKEEGPAEPKVGANVTVVTKRGKEVTGKVVEIDDEIIVLDVDGEDEEFDRSRVETIKVNGGKAGKAKAAEKEEVKEEKTSSRRAAKDEPAEEETKEKRSSNPAGVSVGTRIKEIIADNIDASEADIAKVLKKEGIAFKENTLKLNYVDCHKFLDILKAKKMLKA